MFLSYLFNSSCKNYKAFRVFGMLLILTLFSNEKVFSQEVSPGVATSTFIAGVKLENLIPLDISPREIDQEIVENVLGIIESQIQGNGYDPENPRFTIENRQFRLVVDQQQNGETHLPLTMLLLSLESIVEFRQFVNDTIAEFPGDDEESALARGENVANFLEESLLGITNKRCITALKQRIEYFRRGLGVDSDYLNFGMIKEHALVPTGGVVTDGGTWSGPLSLCSWIALENFYFEFEFLHDGQAKVGTPLTLFSIGANNSGQLISNNMDTDVQNIVANVNQMVQEKAVPANIVTQVLERPWNWKLHAIGDYVVVETAMQLISNVEINLGRFQLEHNCFDVFFKEMPENDASGSTLFLNKEGYCLGRCDAKVVNTVGG